MDFGLGLTVTMVTKVQIIDRCIPKNLYFILYDTLLHLTRVSNSIMIYDLWSARFYGNR